MSSLAQDKARTYRERMKQQGMRQLNIWVPDSRSALIAEKARRQSLLAAGNPAPEEAELLEGVAQDMRVLE